LVVVGIVIITGCTPSRCGRTRYLEIWDLAFEEEQHAQAIIEFQDFIKHCPEGEWTTNARLQIGNCFLHLNDEEQARKYWEEIVQLNWNECTTKQALGCLEHIESNHEKPYPLTLSGKCPLCRK